MFLLLVAFDQDFDTLDADNILSIMENELPTDPLMSQINLNYFHICQNHVESSPNIRDVNPSLKNANEMLAHVLFSFQ